MVSFLFFRVFHSSAFSALSAVYSVLNTNNSLIQIQNLIYDELWNRCTSIQDLTDPKVQKIGIGNPDTVPVGGYTKIALTEVGLWSQLENKTIPGEDVKQVLVYVERGEVDAGFVYATDAKSAQ